MAVKSGHWYKGT